MKASDNNFIGVTVLLFLVSVCAQAQPDLQPKASQGSAELIRLTVTVTNDKGQVVTGLPQSDFSVYEDKVPQRIFSFSNQDEPISVGILFDASGSMRKLQPINGALARFLELSNQSNEYCVVAFNYRPQLLLDWTSDHTTVIEKLASLEPKGNTALYDAFHPTIQKVMHGRYAKRVIILISDGLDNESHHTFKDVRQLLRESNLLVYSVGVFNVDEVGSSLGMEGQSILDEFSSISGGRVFFPRVGGRYKATEVNTVFEMIATELRNQYTIAVAPGNPVGNKGWHKIKVKVSQTNIPREIKHPYVRFREGYYQH